MEEREKYPNWWHSYGRLVSRTLERQESELTFSSGAAHIKIGRSSTPRNMFEVRWIIFTKGQGRVDGFRVFNKKEMVSAFNIAGECGTSDTEFAGRYDADVGIPGYFIRKDDYLNIPCPGTGIGGDPNISIKITQVMRDQITKFIETQTTSASVH